ncbi:MAG TPA: FG-GAP-like repeat-containing protein [Kofleriaceae bacterium]|nr:FG-GAP-like repeat-containing protein [Kofleriaceae bacterium]
MRSRGRLVRAALVLAAALGAAGPRTALAAAGRPVPGSVTPERVKLPSGPSSVRGLADEPSVDAFNAQLRYQVPIELPAGLGGLAPALSLSYSGVLGNGPLGIGWSLSQPRIQRSTRLGVPKFDASDELELSGIVTGRLVSIGNGEYRVEGMGQTVRVTAVDGGFAVDDGRGVHYRLGTSPASRQDNDSTHALAWLVETETNLMGEQIAFEYSHDQGQVYLTRITWGPGGVYTAVLGYETRDDPTRSYRGGFAVVTAQRLTSITVTAFGTERRAYQLVYDQRDPTDPTALPVARLTGITSTGVNHSGAWPALTFRYARPLAPVITPIAGVGDWRLNVNGTTLADVDGDGAADLLQLSSSGHRYLPNQNGTFGAPQAVSGNALSIDVLQLQDVDGDARPELLEDTGSGWIVWKFDQTRWTQVSSRWPGSANLRLKQPDSTRFADLNGDGLIDAMTWSNDGLIVHLGTTTGMASGSGVPRIGGAVLPTAQGRFVDTNGDGLDDYVFVALDHLDVYAGHGDGTFDPGVRVAYPFAVTIASPDEIELADLDRDGLLDLIKIESGNVRWFRGRADGTFTPAEVTLANPQPLSINVVVAIADTNGNGSHDVVWSSPSGMWRMDMAGTTTAGMLVEVQNGLGMDVTFDYQSSHALSAAARQAGNPWASNVPIAMPVPVQKTTALGPGETTRLISYAVRDGFWDVGERRFGGFLTTSVTTAGATPAQTSTLITDYSPGLGVDRELRGHPLVERIFDGTGTRLSIKTSTWQTMAIAGLPDVPLLRRAVVLEVQTQYEDVTPVRQTDVVTTYDPLGRAAHVVDSGRLDLTGDESVTDTRYADDATTWIRDAVCEETVSGSDGVVVSDVQRLFGDDATENALCVAGKGWPRETRALLSSESRFVTQSATSYDGHGNPVSMIENGVERRVVYETSGLFPAEEHMTAPSGSELIWQASWDHVIGAIVALTAPDAHTTHLGYDSLGRLTSTSVDALHPHQIVEYDWTAPFPRTTVWQFDGGLASTGVKPATWSATSGWRQTVDVSNGAGEVRYHADRLADAQWIITGYSEVDPNGRVVFAGRPVFSSQLELSSRPAGIAGDTLAYDPLGRLIEQDLPTGARRTYSYVAFERTMQEADLAPVHSVLDGQGRPITTERSLSDGTHEIVQASYDPAGRLTRMMLAGGTVIRTFDYDTLGRLLRSQDPDLGVRTLTWDDGNRLRSETNAAGQAIQYSYDSLGRLSTRDTGSVYRYHYDAARPGAAGALSNLAGRLAWIEEPTGGLDLGYDELGRTMFTRRRIDARVSEATTSYAASGLVLGRSYDDEFAFGYRYDPAGRVIGAGDLWSVVDQDASGMPLHETTQSQVDTRYERDVLELTSRVTVRDATDTVIYDVRATRNAATEITAITDLDGVGLDHNAAFSYDGFARLTGASIGTGAQAFTFSYSYDALHNMTSRTATGPSALGGFVGTYRYGEGGHAARQLTSIADPTGHVTHTFSYDAAGRQTVEDGRTMTYDGFDRLLRIDGLPGGSVAHVYGQDGSRVKTTEPDGSISYYYGDGTADRRGIREHDVTVGTRVVARVVMTAPSDGGDGPGGPGGGDGPGGPAGGGGEAVRSAFGLAGQGTPWALALVALSCSLVVARPRTRRRARAAGMIGLLLATACSAPRTAIRGQATVTPVATFLHSGFAAGPALFTDATGHLIEERRYEPFGVAIDARFQSGGSTSVGVPDFTARDLNGLNKRTDAATGWSDHGARWTAPETGRWLTPDPPVMGPDASFMEAPWGLHPYQYVNQNPVAYWDPDGGEPAPVNKPQTPTPPATKQFPGISTPLPADAKQDPKTHVVTLNVNVVRLDFAPDADDFAGTGGDTKYKSSFGGLKWSLKGGRVVKIAPVPTPSVRVQTHYAQSANKDGKSAYGRGTTPDDIAAKNTSLRFHEGQHGVTAQQFVREHPVPQFGGRIGMTESEIQKAGKEYDRAMDEYFDSLDKFSRQQVDCVGTTIDQSNAREGNHEPAVCDH